LHLLIGMNYFFLLMLLPLVLIPTASAFDDTEITVSIIGNSVIYLDDNNRLIRAYVDVTNFDPSEGSYLMKIIHLATGTIISEQEILIRETGNDKAGVNVAYMVKEDDVYSDGTSVQGEYEIQITTETGKSVGNTKFSIMKSSNPNPTINNSIEKKSSPSNVDEIEPIKSIQLEEKVTLEPESEIQQEVSPTLETDSTINAQSRIPDWVKNIFIMYAEESISEDELINAIKFLIGQEIIII
jgi:hypothetical protein